MAEASIQQIFEVDPNENVQRKCDMCQYRVTNRYVLAHNKRHAAGEREVINEEDRNGMCADCFIQCIRGEPPFDDDDSFSVVRNSAWQTLAAGVTVPGIDFDVNSDLPPAGESYSHEQFSAGMEWCPVEDCSGKLTRVRVVSDTADGGEPANHHETLEVSCQSCRRVLFKSESVVYHRSDEDGG